MGPHLVHLLVSITPPLSNPRLLSSTIPTSTRCCSTRYGGRNGGSRWDDKTVRTEGFRLNLEDHDFLSDDGDESDYRSSLKQRVWWLDDSLDDEEDDDFGVFEESIAIGWVFRAFRAFGWMLPAIAISMLLGTGPNALFMAVGLPLAQSAFSLVIDTLSGRATNDNPRTKPRAQKKPFARAASNTGVKKEKEKNTWNDRGRRNRQSGAAPNAVSVESDAKNTSNFGGWDELDKQLKTDEACETMSTQKINTRPQKKNKMSRRVRSRETPFLIRVLIAVFPFIGSWANFL